jgi:galactonate dehydratase
MRIRDVRAFNVFDGHWRNHLIVKVDGEDGLYGVGESGLAWQEAAVAATVESLRPLLVGQDATRKEHLWQTMFRGGFFPGGRTLMSAISAIDTALWDLHGKALGVPVYELLGGRCRDRVVCYPHTRCATVEELIDDARRHVAEGWRFIRWYLQGEGDVVDPRRAVRFAVEQTRALREAVGPDVELILDIHTRLDPHWARELCIALRPFELFFIEDPLRAENPSWYELLRRHVSAPIAAGEQHSSKWEFRELIERELIDYARIDVCLVGGLTEARKIAGWCETHGIDLAPHNPLGPVSAAACLHLDLASSNFGVQELPRRPGELADVFPVQLEWRDGCLLPPERPGLGVEFDEQAALRRPGQAWEAPKMVRPDGSFTNW